MKKTVLLAAILCCAMLSQSFAANAQTKAKPIISKVQIATFTDRSVYALFQFLDDTGCILTSVAINAALDSTTVNGVTTNTPSAGVEIDQVDICSSTPLISGFGLSNAKDVLYVAPDLSYAHLKMKVTLVDTMTNEPFDGDVDVVWKATGRVQVQNDHSVTTPDPKTTVVEVTHVASRPATATGTIFAPGTSVTPLYGNLIPDPSFDGAISALVDTTVTTTKP